jgi:hypothetical protein
MTQRKLVIALRGCRGTLIRAAISGDDYASRDLCLVLSTL